MAEAPLDRAVVAVTEVVGDSLRGRQNNVNAAKTFWLVRPWWDEGEDRLEEGPWEVYPGEWDKETVRREAAQRYTGGVDSLDLVHVTETEVEP